MKQEKGQEEYYHDNIHVNIGRRRKMLSSAVMYTSGALTAVLAIPAVIFAAAPYIVIKAADRLIRWIEGSQS